MNYYLSTPVSKESDPAYRKFVIGEFVRGTLAVVAGVLLGVGLAAAGEPGLGVISVVVGAPTIYGLLHLR